MNPTDELRYDLVLRDPGLVPNSASGEHCVHACFQMLYRTWSGMPVPGFAELDATLGKLAGKYTYEFNLLAAMCADFDVEVVWALDLEALATDPQAELLRHFGSEIGRMYVDNSDLDLLAEHAGTVLRSNVAVHPRPADIADVVGYLTQGYYLTATINQRVLQSDPGYVAHSILIYGCSRRGVRVHNPGPPATAASEIAWNLFERAWGSPNFIAVRPRERADPDALSALVLALRSTERPGKGEAHG